MSRYQEIAIISKDNPSDGSYARQHTAELFEGSEAEIKRKQFKLAEWINPDRGEMFFAKRAIFVEGATEKVIFPYLAAKLKCMDTDFSVIDCGSKNNLPYYVTLANAFRIPFTVVHDEDPLPESIPDHWTPEKKREKQRTFDLNSEIAQQIDSTFGKVEIISPDFEGAFGVSKSQGVKKGKALAALEHFEPLNSEEIPRSLEQMVRRLYGGT